MIKSYFNRIKRRLNQDNRGSAIILVIIAMAMIGILATTIGWSSYINFKIKAADRKTKVSFYEAEVALDQIMAGLQNEAAICLRSSYEDVMKNWEYDESSGIITHTNRFYKDYVEAMWDELDADGVTLDYKVTARSHCDLSTLRQYVDQIAFPESVWGCGDKVEMLYSPVTATIVLKNVSIKYVKDDYVTKITTDYEIVTPSLSFTQELPISDLLKGDYYIIGDTGIEVTGQGILKLHTNAYAGEEGIKIGSSDPFNPGKGLLLVEEDCTELLSRGDIELLDTKSRFDISSSSGNKPRSIYANGVILNGNKGYFTIDLGSDEVSLYFQDDIELRGDESTVDLANGNLYGYGNGNSATPAGESSAIIINGTNSKLNLGVHKLLLAGTAYVGNHRSAGDIEKDADLPNEKFDPTRMGESITVKGGQIAYLAPNESIELVTDDVNENFIGNLGINPVSYNGLKAGTKAKCNVDKGIYKLNGASISSFGVKDIREFYDSTNGLEYFYLVFSSDEYAKEYFKKYYGYEDEMGFSKDSKTAIDTYIAMRYANNGIILAGADTANTEGSVYEYSISGNVFTYDPTLDIDDPNKIKLREYDYDSVANTEIIDSIIKTRDAKFKVADIFDNMIDTDSIENIGYMEFDTGIYKAIVTNDDDYEITDDSVRFVLSNGNITIPNDYRGCAFAKGTIKFATGASNKVIDADPVGIYEAMNAIKVDSNGVTWSPLSFFKKNPIAVNPYGQIDVDFTEVVKYANWIKQ